MIVIHVRYPHYCIHNCLINVFIVIVLQGDNLVLDIEAHPEYQFYCNRVSRLIVNLTDLKNSPSIDPVPWNNAQDIPIFLNCGHGQSLNHSTD